MLRSFAILITFAAAFALSGCMTVSPQQRNEIAGSVVGAGAGLLLADAFNANPVWSVGAGLAGAAIGQRVARNTATGECAYYAGRNAQGQAVYRTGAC
jgi:hypothetical protein